MKGCAQLLAVLSTVALAAVPAHALQLPGWLAFGDPVSDPVAIRPVVTETVEDRGEALRWVPGVIASRNQVDMAFQTLGRMTIRHVDLGDRVRAGAVLAELATEDLQASTRAARASLDSAEVQVRTADATLERTRALAERNVASAAQLEQAQRAASAARAAAEQARSQLAQAQNTEGYAKMTAPFDGVVSAVYETAGTVVSAGEPVVQLSSEDEREAVIDLPEQALVGLAPEAVFTVWQRGDPNSEVPATLSRIDPLADRATRTRRLYLDLPPDTPLRLGALIRARLGNAGDPTLTVPEQAVFDLDGTSHVWRVNREGEAAKVQAVPIKTGSVFLGRILVSEGLSMGDEVVIRGVHSLSDGQTVGPSVAP